MGLLSFARVRVRSMHGLRQDGVALTLLAVEGRMYRTADDSDLIFLTQGFVGPDALDLLGVAPSLLSQLELDLVPGSILIISCIDTYNKLDILQLYT